MSFLAPGFLGGAYLWIKAAHVIFAIFWMAGLFMLPRFFVYHQEAGSALLEGQAWIERERRLINIILKPAMLATWAFGLLLVLNTGAYAETWFALKFLTVLALSAYHAWIVRYAERLAKGGATIGNKQLRLLNEVPGLAAIIIVILVIVRPFS